jgi:hypothetical protein
MSIRVPRASIGSTREWSALGATQRAWCSSMKKHSESDAAAYAEATIAAILALGTLDGHRLETVIDKYREVLMKLREKSGGAFNP